MERLNINIGDKYNRWTVLEFAGKNKNGSKLYLCECECGTKRIVMGTAIKNGHSKSCGCLHKEIVIQNNLNHMKLCRFDLTNEYGIGYTSKNDEFYFDIEDYDKIKNLGWYIGRKGYLVVGVDKKLIYLHRYIMDCPEGYVVDHVNHDKSDNRKENLRIVSSSQNNMNRTTHKNNKSGVKGVCWVEKEQKWVAYLMVNGVNIRKMFDDKDEAIVYRKLLEEKYHGDFAYNEDIAM